MAHELRLIDVLRSKKYGSNVPDLPPAPVPVPEAVIDATAAYLTNPTVTVADLPTVAPPFRDFWIEIDDPELIHRFGGHVTGHRRADGRFELRLLLAVEQGNEIAFPFSGIEMTLDQDGAPRISRACLRPLGLKNFDPFRDTERESFAALLTVPILFAISLMHCKNVTMREAVPNARLCAARERRGHPPLLRYHVLDVDPMKRVLRDEGRMDEVGLARALHICRGHFKDYRQSGLFGKHKGIFWWDMTARGKVEQGIVDKDYEIVGGKNAP